VVRAHGRQAEDLGAEEADEADRAGRRQVDDLRPLCFHTGDQVGGGRECEREVLGRRYRNRPARLHGEDACGRVRAARDDPQRELPGGARGGEATDGAGHAVCLRERVGEEQDAWLFDRSSRSEEALLDFAKTGARAGLVSRRRQQRHLEDGSERRRPDAAPETIDAREPGAARAGPLKEGLGGPRNGPHDRAVVLVGVLVFLVEQLEKRLDDLRSRRGSLVVGVEEEAEHRVREFHRRAVRALRPCPTGADLAQKLVDRVGA
jgi:hypothetical protein